MIRRRCLLAVRRHARRIPVRQLRRLSEIKETSESLQAKRGGHKAGEGGGVGLGHVFATLLGAAAVYGLASYGVIEFEKIKPSTASVPFPAPESSADSRGVEEAGSGSGSAKKAKKSRAKDEGRPAAGSQEDLYLRIFEAYKQKVLGEDAKKLEKYDSGVKIAEDGSVDEIRGTKLPVKTLEDANEIINLLEALNRGLLAQSAEDTKAFDFKIDVFKQLAPIFLKEAELMLAAERKKMTELNKDKLKKLEMEFYKQIVIQLEHQKHSLFTEYQTQLKRVEASYDEKLSRASDNIKAAFDSKLKTIERTNMTERAKRKKILDQLKTRVAGLDMMIDHAIEAQKRGQQVWELSLRLFDVQEAIDTNQPFASEWEALLDASKGDEIIKTAIVSVPPNVVANGVSTRDQLTGRFFSKVERAAREAALVDKSKPGGPGTGNAPFIGYALAKVTSWLLLPQRTFVPGTQPEQIISRAGFYVCNGDLGEAAKELAQLQGEPASIVSDWIKSAKDRLLLEQTIGVIKTRMSHLDVTTVSKS